MKPVFVVDFDDTLAYWASAFVVWWNRTHHTSYDLEQFRGYGQHVTDLMELPRKVSALDLVAFSESQEYRSVTHLPGVLEVIPRIAQIADIHIVTARLPNDKDDVVDWLNRFGLMVFITKIHCVGGVSKLETTRSLNARAFADDKPSTALEHAEVGIVTFMPSMPWNHGVEHQHIHPFVSWVDVEQKIIFHLT